MIKYHNTRTEYIISCRSKGEILLNFGEKIALQPNYTLLAVEQNNYATKIVNICIVYDLDNWPKNPLRKFTLKIVCLERLM